jgi:nucleoside-diphosphate-sugar epimerase
LLSSGARVRGFATRADSLRQIEAAGADAHRLDLDGTLGAVDFSGEVVYYSVPPAPHAGEVRLDRFLQNVSGVPARLVYLSTTGVYGDHLGAPVDEDVPPAPRTERAVRRLQAENKIREWADSRRISWCVLRVSGIYGPGRLPLDRLRRRVPAIVAQEATPGNRIHVADLATACLAAGRASAAHRRIYNVADGNHHSLTEYLQRVADIAGLPRPPLITRAEAERTMGATPESFLSESRRIDNGRMLRELGVALAYGDLDAGIRASLDQAS